MPLVPESFIRCQSLSATGQPDIPDAEINARHTKQAARRRKNNDNRFPSVDILPQSGEIDPMGNGAQQSPKTAVTAGVLQGFARFG